MIHRLSQLAEELGYHSPFQSPSTDNVRHPAGGASSIQEPELRLEDLVPNDVPAQSQPRRVTKISLIPRFNERIKTLDRKPTMYRKPVKEPPNAEQQLKIKEEEDEVYESEKQHQLQQNAHQVHTKRDHPVRNPIPTKRVKANVWEIYQDSIPDSAHNTFPSPKPAKMSTFEPCENFEQESPRDRNSFSRRKSVRLIERSPYDTMSAEARVRQYLGGHAEEMIKKMTSFESQRPLREGQANIPDIPLKARKPETKLTVPRTPEFMKRSLRRVATMPEPPKLSLGESISAASSSSARTLKKTRSERQKLHQSRSENDPNKFVSTEPQEDDPISTHMFQDWETKGRRETFISRPSMKSSSISTSKTEHKKHRRSIQAELDLMHRRVTLASSDQKDPVVEFAQAVAEKARRRRSVQDLVQERLDERDELIRQRTDEEKKRLRDHLRMLRASLRHVPHELEVTDSYVQTDSSSKSFPVTDSRGFNRRAIHDR